MNGSQTRQNWLTAYGLAVGSGLLLAAAFPKFSLAGFAWVAPAMMLFAAIGCSGQDAFRIGYVAGLAFWLASLHWLLFIPVTGFPILGWVALAAYNAAFQGAWVWLCWKCFPIATPAPGPAATSSPQPEPVSSETGAAFRTPRSAFRTFDLTSRLDRLRWAVVCASLWVALEMIRSRLFGGFPWSLLGVSQYEMTPLLQISSYTGVYGVSFLIVWTSVSLFCAGLMLLRPNASRTTFAAELFAPLLVVAVVFATGYHRVTHAPGPERVVRLTTIQPSIPQTMIWDGSASEQRFAELLALSEAALSIPTDVLLWPEAALPELNQASYHALTNLAVAHNVWFIFGADDVQYRPGATNDEDVIYFNAAWLLSPRGLMADTYHKRRLVIFGEYIPLLDWLPFIKWFTPITGSFSAGTNATQFPLRDIGITAAPLICFEDCFPHGVREHVTEDTDLLVNLTNDGWFGESAEQWQHAANAVFRAIENRRPLVRSCNNGLTCWIDEYGRLREIFRDEKGTIYGAGFKTFTIPISKTPHLSTFYNRHGDLFGWACVVLATFRIALLGGRRRKWARKPSINS